MELCLGSLTSSQNSSGSQSGTLIDYVRLCAKLVLKRGMFYINRTRCLLLVENGGKLCKPGPGPIKAPGTNGRNVLCVHRLKV